ncbi:MAG: pilus (MSHA type) biogenesis protein MshL [Helicobacter sp.]|nr:pilus (MSHA type) biogenesis protein MshL [Helicobacter sp.]
MNKWFLGFLLATAIACPITIVSNGEVSLEELLVKLSLECKMNIIVKDSYSTQRIKEIFPILHLSQIPIQDSMEVLLHENGLFYEIEDSVLRIFGTKTQVFQIHYVATERSGVSSTEVSISRNDGGMGYRANSGNEHDIFEKSGGSRSGVNITTEDKLNFWSTIATELHHIIYRPGETLPMHVASLDTNGTARTSNIIINKAAGLITVTGTKSQLERVTNYLDILQNSLTRQVMIDLSILTITHNNTHTTGIDWNQLYSLQNFSTIPQTDSAQNGFMQLSNGEFSYSLNLFPQNITLNRIVEFLSQYGEVSTLSNPKLLTLNNQPAMISVGDVIRYRKNTVFQSSANTTTNTNTDTEYPSVFAGVLLDITPSIFENNLMLKINPSITSLKGREIQNAAQALDSPPNLSANQLSSIVYVSNGKKIVIGGLIRKSSNVESSGIPILMDIPLLSYLFSYKQEIQNTIEMVIVITPYIVNIDNIDSMEESQ